MNLPVTSQALDGHEELLRFLYLCPVGVAEVDERGEIRMLNPLASQLLMPLAADANLDNLFRLLAPFDSTLQQKILLTNASASKACEGYRIAVGDAGHRRHLEFAIVRLEAARFMVAFTDVSRLVEAEQQARDAIELQARQAGKLEIASGVLHDIGNAVISIGVRSARLNADIGRPELVQIQRLAAFLHLNGDCLATALGIEKAAALTQFVAGLTNALTERFAYWEDSARILAQTVAHIQAILNIQRANAGMVALYSFDLSLSELLVDVLAIQSGPISKRDIAVICKVAPEVPRLRADRTKLVQVLINVIKNACESFDEPGAPAEGRSIAISTTVQAEQIRIEIADNGCGFSADSPAAQMRRGVSTKADGSGLGLASTRSLVALHGGTADILSPGRGLGATVHLTFPIQSELRFV